MLRHIVVTEYNPEWKQMFWEETKKIQAILGKNLITIHHIGSTSVEGLKAKPIIDIMPIVRDINLVDHFKCKFEAIGYEYLGEFGIQGRRYLRKLKIINENMYEDVIHVHIFDEESKEDIKRHLAVRDYLKSHADIANQYAELKSQLAKEFAYDNDSYCDGKDEFVKQMEKDALKWYK